LRVGDIPRNSVGFIIIGQTSNYGAGNNDFWVVKTKSDGSCPPFGIATNATVNTQAP
jgi:hypothetical protein